MTANLDTKALRALLNDACNLDNRSLMEVLLARQKYERAIMDAAPALLATVEAQRKEIEEYTEACQRAADEIGRRMYVEDKLTAERDALKAEVETLLQAIEKMAADGLSRIGKVGAASTRANRLEAKLSAAESEAARLREALEASRVSITYAIEALHGGLADSDRTYLVNVLVHDEQVARSALTPAPLAQGSDKSDSYSDTESAEGGKERGE